MIEGFLQSLRAFLIRSGAIGLLVGLPLLLLIFALEPELEKEALAIRTENARNLEYQVSRFLDPEFPRYFFHGSFQNLMERAKANPHPEIILNQEFSGLKKDFPDTFEMVVFDRKNQVIASCSDLPEFHPLLNQFGSEYMLFINADSLGLNDHLGKYRGFIGPYFSEFFPNQRWKGFANFISFSRKRAWLIIPRLEIGKPWFMVWVSLPTDGQAFPFQMALRNWSMEKAVHGILDLDEPPELWGTSLGPASPFIPRALGALGTQEGKVVFSDGHIWTQIIISSRKKWIVALPDFAMMTFWDSCRRLRNFSGLFLLVCILLWELFRERIVLSLRLKLIFLSLYMSGVPLFLLFLSAQGLFQERRLVMEKQIHRIHEETIREFNRRFLDYLGWIEKVTMRVKEIIVPDGLEGRETVLRELKNIQQHTKPFNCELFDEKGTSIFHFSRDRNGFFQKIAPFFGIQVAKSCAVQNRTDLSLKESTREEAIKATVESLGLDLDGISSMFLCSPNSMINFKFGEEDIYALNLWFYDREKKLKYSAFLGWGGQAIDDFIEKRLVAFQKTLPDISLGTWVDRYHRGIPQSYHLREKMGEIFSLLQHQGMPIHTRVVKEGKTYLLTGVLGKELGRCFLAYSSDETVVAEIRKTAVRLTGMGIFLLAMGLGIGLLIGRSFLLPVELLSQGMKSLQNQDFSARVPVLSHDEFGSLSQAFNLLMESMADLEVAKIVQDTFFPQATLKKDEWEIFGTSVSASRVGGDYFDYFPLSDGRWLLLIGDVSGHGVTSALVVGMAKALVFHPANPRVPSEILSILKSYLTKTLAGRMMMTCFLGIFDPRTGSLTASNAGHNDPCLVQGEKVEEVKIRNIPLGIMHRRPYQDHSLVLSGDQVLVFFTDGLIEALDEKGKMIGYERFSQHLPGLIGPDAAGTEKRIREWFREIAEDGPLADDITIMVLQKHRSSQISPEFLKGGPPSMKPQLPVEA